MKARPAVRRFICKRWAISGGLNAFSRQFSDVHPLRLRLLLRHVPLAVTDKPGSRAAERIA